MWMVTLVFLCCIYFEKCCHLIFSQLPNSSRNIYFFFPIRNNESTSLATEEKCPGNSESSLVGHSCKENMSENLDFKTLKRSMLLLTSLKNQLAFKS